MTYLKTWTSRLPGRVAQSVGHLTPKSGVLDSIPGLATYFRFSFRFFKKGSCQLLAKVLHEVLVNRLGGLSPRKSVVRLTDRPDMTLDIYRGCKSKMQQCNNVTPIFRARHCMKFFSISIQSLKFHQCLRCIHLAHMQQNDFPFCVVGWDME